MIFWVTDDPFGMSIKRFKAKPSWILFRKIIKECKKNSKILKLIFIITEIKKLIDECIKNRTLFSLGSNAHSQKRVGKHNKNIMKKIKVLITGAGSGVGQSIAKSLKITKLNIKIIFADINLLNSGLYRFKNSIIAPKVENRGSLNWYIKTLKKLKIDILMIGSEYDLMFFSKHAEIIKQKTKCLVCVSNQKNCKYV